MEQLNVFGEPLPICCEDPMTGFTRSGSCETMGQDHGMHTVCAHMTDEFLSFSKAQGNDLSTPVSLDGRTQKCTNPKTQKTQKEYK